VKTILGFKVGGFILAAAFFADLGFSTNAPAQQLYTYLVDLNSRTATDIGSWGGGSYARGVNDAGQVVGE